MKNRRLGLVFCLTCLCVGTLIYAGTRPESIYLNQWISQIGEGKVLLFLQGILQKVQLPEWTIYSLPDALWMLGLTMVILTIWDFRLHKTSIPWIALGIATGLIFEISQGFHIVGGTFDTVDLIFILMGALLPISFIMLKMRLWKTN